MRRIYTLLTVLVLVTLVFSGCGAKRPGTSKSEEIQMSSADQPVQSTGAALSVSNSMEMTKGSLESMDRKVIKNGEIQLEVKDLRETVNRIFTIVKEYGGYIQSSSTRNNERQIFSEIVVKVPSSRFEEFFGRLKQMDKLIYDSISTQDVTEEYIDNQARLKVLKAQEERLVALMEKAQKIEDLLKIENELSRIRNEIEQIQGRINFLDKATSFSTVNIGIKQLLVSHPAAGSIMDGILYNLRDGWGAFFELAVDTLQVIAWLSPFIILAAIIILIVKKNKKWCHFVDFWKRRKN
ncbi:MAG TPA: DUF4349 domain-containing protein [Thermoanaerobacterales bacterium]|nr:DUF4349 domain-containing protein [Thermoanaerobacterales bacterium]